MNKRIVTGAVLALAASAIAGCSAAQEPLAVAQTGAEVSSQTNAGKLAQALAEADRAFDAQDDAKLRTALKRIGWLGGRVDIEQVAADPVAEWRERVPDLSPPMRGRVLGPAYRRGAVAAGGREQLQQLFLSGQKAQIALETTSGDKLQLAVFDAQDKAVCGPNVTNGRCEWIPIFTQRYRIEIVNPERRGVRYYLVID